MGAIEFAPAIGPKQMRSKKVDVEALVALASDVLAHRNDLQGSFAESHKHDALKDILRVGTSAGGARAKAVIAWNPMTHEVRSGQIPAEPGFEYWLLKFDGVTGNKDKELDDPQGYGAVEYAYSLMAKSAGITMTDCRLLEEHGRRHFMTRRFDRLRDGTKGHLQSLCAMAHVDFNRAGAYAYEQALLVIRQLHLPMETIEQQFRRAGHWTSTHQMTINGKRDRFTMRDFRECANSASMKRGRADTLVDEVREAVRRWAEFAETAGVSESLADGIQKNFRLNLAPS